MVAERAGLRIHEVPVDWVDDPDSSVDIVRTALDDLTGIARLGPRAGARARCRCARSASGSAAPAPRPGAAGSGMQVGIFLVIGVCSTLAYALLYLGLRTTMTPVVGQLHRAAGDGDRQHGGQPAVHLRGARPRDVVRHQVQGLAIFAAGLAVTTGSLWLLHAPTSPSRGARGASC